MEHFVDTKLIQKTKGGNIYPPQFFLQKSPLKKSYIPAKKGAPSSSTTILQWHTLKLRGCLFKGCRLGPASKANRENQDLYPCSVPSVADTLFPNMFLCGRTSATL